MPVSVFPERMDKLDPEDVNASLRIIESYIHYICERTEFALTNTFRTTTGLGSSAEAVSLVLEEAVNDIASLEGEIGTVQSDLNGKVDKAEGMGLSHNDYTNEDKGILASLLTAETFGPSSRISFDAAGGGLPLKSCIVGIQPVQSGSGTPSTSNVREISGWTGAQIFVSPTTSGDDGKTIAVDWTTEAGTVYSGTLDVVTGVLTVTHWSVTVSTAKSTSFGRASSGTLPYLNVYFLDDRQSVSNGTVLCNLYPQSTSAKNGFFRNFGNAVTVYDTRFTSKSNAVETLTSEGFMAVYPLAVPIMVHLTPQAVTVLAGMNYIWADAGDVTVEYGAFLGALHAEIEALQEGGN